MANNYVRTNWVNDETPLNEINMNNIEEGIAEVREIAQSGKLTDADRNFLNKVQYRDASQGIDVAFEVDSKTGPASIGTSTTTLATLSSIRYGLPNINNVGADIYNSNLTIYAPTKAPLANQIIVSDSTLVPKWVNISDLKVGGAVLADKATSDANGKNIASTYATKNQTISNITTAPGSLTFTLADGTSHTVDIIAASTSPVTVSPTAPSTNNLWVDSSQGYIAKAYFEGNWIALRGVWG